jgi:hypothetical protein
MTTFAVYHKRLDGPLPFPQGAPMGHITRLFILGVPEGITAQIIGEILRKAGRDPALMDVSVSSITIAAEPKWPNDVKNDFGSTGPQKISWEALQDEARDWRRITIRVTPQVFVLAQAEAQRRSQSLTQFCVDAIQMQVGTRSHRIEDEIFRFIYAGGYSERTRSASLPLLRSYVARNIPDCTFQELEYGLRRLHHAAYLHLDKWEDDAGEFRPYDGSKDEEFFYRASFRMEVTPKGKPYAEALSGTTRAIDGFLNIVRAEPGTETRLGEFAVFFTSVDSAGGVAQPRYCENLEKLKAFLIELGLGERSIAEVVAETLASGSSNIRISLQQSRIDLF